MANSNQKVFVVFNPKAGKEDQSEEIRSAVANTFTLPQWTTEIYQTTGKEDVSFTPVSGSSAIHVGER